MTQKDFWNLEDRDGKKIFGRRFDGGSIGSVGDPITPVTPGTPQLTTPSISAFSGTVSGSIAISVSIVPNAVSYTARVYSDAGATTLVSTVTSYVSGANITGLTPGVTYYSRVTAIADGVNYTNSNASNIASAVAYAAPVLTPGFGAAVTTNILSELNTNNAYLNMSNIGTITVFNARCFAYNSIYAGGNRKITVINVENSTTAFGIEVPETSGVYPESVQPVVPFILGGVLYISVINNEPSHLGSSNLYKLNNDLAWELVLSRVLDPNATRGNQFSTSLTMNSSNWWGVRYSSYTIVNGGLDYYWKDPQFVKLNSNGTYQIFTTPILPSSADFLGMVVDNSRIWVYGQNYETTGTTPGGITRYIYDISSGSPVLLESTVIGYNYNETLTKLPIAVLSNGHVSSLDTAGITSTSISWGGKRQIYSGGMVSSQDYIPITINNLGNAGDNYGSGYGIFNYWYFRQTNIVGVELDSTRNGSAIMSRSFEQADTSNSVTTYSYKTRFFLLRNNLSIDTGVIAGVVIGSTYDPVTNRIWCMTREVSGTGYIQRVKYLTVGS